MKKFLTLLMTVTLALSMVACGNKAEVVEGPTENLVVDGVEVTVKDFLIEHLSDYIKSQEYLDRVAAFEKELGEAVPFEVTYAMEFKLDGYGAEAIDLHFLLVKANCNYLVEGGSMDSITMAIDYDTGIVYDAFDVDESWLEKGDKEQAIYVAAKGGCFSSSDYNGENIFMDGETHTILSASDIAEINTALAK